MKFVIKNNTTKKEYEYQVSDIMDSSIYYHFNLSIDDNMDDGEYEYTLSDEEDNVLATGLLQIGDYVQTNVTAYTKETKETYIQYNGSI